MRNSIVKVLALVLLLAFCLPARISSVAAPPPPGRPQAARRVFLPAIPNRADTVWRWSALRTLRLTPAPSRAPTMYIDRSGSAHLLWDTFSTGGSAPIYHIQQTSSGWSAPEKVATVSGTSKMLAPPLLGKDGRAHFLWYNQMGFGGPYRLLYSSYDGTAWSPSEEAYRSSSASLTGMLHFDETDAPQALARTQDVDLILYHTSRTRSGWSAAVQLLTDPFAVWHSWGIAPDGSGGVHLLEDDYSGRFSYSYWKNGVFTVKDRKIAGTAGGRSVQSDGLGNVHLAWMGTISLPGGGANGLSHQCLTGNLLGDRLALSGAQNIEAFRSAADGAAQVLYAWKLQGGRQIGFALLEGCQVKLAKTLDLPPAPLLSRWEGLEAVATSAQPHEVCMLLKISSGEYGLLCAAPAK